MTDSAGGPDGGIVHVVDDDEDVLWAVETLLLSDGFAVRTYPSATAFLAALPELGRSAIGCVLTDVRMPEVDGLELLRRLGAARGPASGRPVLVMTAHGDVAMAVRAMKAGAFDFIEKPFDDAVLLSAVRAALAVPSPGRGEPAPPDRPELAEAAARIATLSPREREVLDLAMEGKPSKVIAHELGISPRTVEVHRLRLMARLGVGSLAEAVRLAVWADLGNGEASARTG
ncbi:response regulator transcription factor [Teichococcus oryzae]|uniref:Response regulator n=1 Tax=Teichococcus oryzae TaxID=1608942 RepID=A0A5B2TGR8_9PROT|nr:response regulator [Pseudoroseomonas oryzae]KAA2213691.1 response regulator [Pseudoroseomonas oryzae]